MLRSQSRKRSIAVAVLLAAALSVGAWFSRGKADTHRDSQGPLAVLRSPTDSVGAAINDPVVGALYSFGSIIPCRYDLADSDTQVFIRSLAFESIEGDVDLLEPVTRSLQTDPTMIGSQEGFPPAGTAVGAIDKVVVDWDCDSDNPATTEIVVGMQLAGSDGGYVSGLVIEYDAGAETYKLLSDVSFVLCGPSVGEFVYRCP